MEDRWFRIGFILRSHGLKGELKIEPLGPNWEAVTPTTRLRIEDRYGNSRDVSLVSARQQGSYWLATFDEIRDRTTADKFAGGGVIMEERDLAELPPDSYYVKDIIGMTVIGESGQEFGKVTRILEMPAHDLYEVDVQGELKLIPAIAEFIISVDPSARNIKVRTIPGLLDNDQVEA